MNRTSNKTEGVLISPDALLLKSYCKDVALVCVRLFLEGGT